MSRDLIVLIVFIFVGSFTCGTFAVAAVLEIHLMRKRIQTLQRNQRLNRSTNSGA